MNFKKTWTKKYGKSEIYKAGECACRKVEMDMLRLCRWSVGSSTARRTRSTLS